MLGLMLYASEATNEEGEGGEDEDEGGEDDDEDGSCDAAMRNMYEKNDESKRRNMQLIDAMMK